MGVEVISVLLLFGCRCAGICSSLYGVSTADGFIYGGYGFCRVICIELQTNADDLQANTAEIEERLMFLLLFLLCLCVSTQQLPKTASAGDLLVWRRFPAASWWSVLLLPLNLLVSCPSPVRETGKCGVGRKGGVVADRSVSASGTTPSPADGHRHCCGCWG